MRARRALVLILAGMFATCGNGGAADPLSDSLAFEVPDEGGGFAGWQGSPAATVARDSSVVHGGRFAARLKRDASSPNQFSSLGRALPLAVSGDTLELRGWLRTEGVTGFAGLWLSEDGISGSLEFDNMEDRRLAGTTPWTEYRIALPLNRRAKSIAFGALLAGAGIVHADDLQLLVDGRPIADAPAVRREPTAVETDHQFDGGSGVLVARLSPRQIEHVWLLGKVWGFVKYHHPRATSAGLHWDYELFRVLPRMLEARDRTQALARLDAWLERVGDPVAPESPAAPPDSAQLAPRTDWIRDRSRLGPALSARLQRIHARRDADEEQHYVSFAAGIGKPDFSKEADYAGRPDPDAGYRLLALFRFWNIIEYWFPYRDVIGEDWDEVLREFIPRLVEAGSGDEYRLAMMALAARVNDGHANLWGSVDVRPPRGGCRLPVALRVVEGRFVVGAYADSALARASGLEIGDEILTLDGAPADSLAKVWSPYYGASNGEARRRDLARSLTLGDCGPCAVTGVRGGTPFRAAARRDSVAALNPRAGLTHDWPGETFRKLDPEVAYLKLSSASAAEAAEHVREAEGTKCLIVDLRGYPKEHSVFAFGPHLVDRPTPIAVLTHADPANPGAFLWRAPIRLMPQEPRYTGRVVVLVDEVTQSRGEYTALALRAVPNAIVVGSTTAGADGDVSRIPLPGGTYALISGVGVFTPDRRPTQRVGIVPDRVVRPTLEGIRAGRDEVLEAAIKIALGRETVIRR